LTRYAGVLFPVLCPEIALICPFVYLDLHENHGH